MPALHALGHVLEQAPRLSFRRAVPDVFSERPGVFVLWRDDVPVHVQATDDLGFELHVIRHGLHGHSDFLRVLRRQVVRPGAVATDGRWDDPLVIDGRLEVSRLVRDQLTYSLQVVHADDSIWTSSEVALPNHGNGLVAAPVSAVDWSDGWLVPVHEGR